MKTAVVYFSRNGSTKIAAEILMQKLGADIYRLEEVKKRGRSVFSNIAAGFSGMAGKKSDLVNTFAHELKQYDTICIGSPVWAGNPVPAVNTFIDAADAAGKEIIVFCMQADKNPYKSGARCADIIKTVMEGKGAKVINVLKLYNAKAEKTGQKGHIQKQIDGKL